MLIGVDASRATASQRTGTESYSLNLIRALSGLVLESGHQLRLYHRSEESVDLFGSAEGIEHVLIPFPLVWTHLRLAGELHKRPPDIFYTPAHVIPYSYHQPSVATVHDLGYFYYPEAHTRRQLRYLQWSTRHNSNRARKIIADSETTKSDLLRLLQVDGKKIEVVYPGLDPYLECSPDPEQVPAVLEKYGICQPYLLYIGTIQPRKNLIRLINSFLTSELEHQLVLAGRPGWLSGPIVAHVDSLDAEQRKRILFPGYVDEADKGALISAADALLYPSLYEGFGFPLIEANACGTPVMASNTSSLPEIAGKAALLVDPSDESAMQRGIEQIVSDSALRANLTRTGLENASRFSWDLAAQKILAILESTTGA